MCDSLESYEAHDVNRMFFDTVFFYECASSLLRLAGCPTRLRLFRFVAMVIRKKAVVPLSILAQSVGVRPRAASVSLLFLLCLSAVQCCLCLCLMFLFMSLWSISEIIQCFLVSRSCLLFLCSSLHVLHPARASRPYYFLFLCSLN